MPVGTIDPNEYERFELKSLPANPNLPGEAGEAGFIELRPLPYGMSLARRDKATTMKMKAAQDNKAARSQGGDLIFETASEWATSYDLAYCVGDHNITDSNGVKLDFTNPMTLKQLNPKLGAEIEGLLFKLNEGDEAESAEDFFKRLESSSGTEPESSDGASTEQLRSLTPVEP